MWLLVIAVVMTFFEGLYRIRSSLGISESHQAKAAENQSQAAAPQVFVFGGYEAELAHVDRWDTASLTWSTLELPEELQGVCFAAVAVS